MANELATEGASGVDAPRIGPRLKAARQAQRLTLDDLAASCGITKGYLSKIERDHASASVATLVRICAALNIPVGSLFESSAAGEVVRADNYPPISFGGERMVEFLLTPFGERRIQSLLSRIEPGGGSGSETYELPVDVAFVYVVSGRIRISFNGPGAGEDVTLATGDAFTFSPQLPHSFRALGDDTATVLWILAPALPDDVRPTSR
nr:XRE family transcriptional regulator [Rhodococcus wratislaviensis]GLK36696.1 transcriptional regulator [Rhodococcus wratislaviensis]